MNSEDYFARHFKSIAKDNDIDELKRLYDNEKTPDILMMFSATYGNLNFIKFLEAQDVSIHCENNFVFQISCSHNYTEITRYIISRVYKTDYYINEALLAYASNGNIEFVEELIEMGADVSYLGNEAVIYAHNAQMVKLLSDNGANIAWNYDHILRIAKQNGKDDIIEYLESLDIAK